MTMNQLHVGRLLGFRPGFFAGMVVLWSTAGAQSQSDSIDSPASRQQFCAGATTVVANAGQVTSPASRLVNDSLYTALASMYSCPDIGPVALSRMWDNPPSGPTTLRLLAGVTGQIRDQRLLDKMTALAEDPAGTRHARLGAMAVLVSYFDPHVFIDSNRGRHSIRAGVRAVVVASISHGS